MSPNDTPARRAAAVTARDLVTRAIEKESIPFAPKRRREASPLREEPDSPPRSQEPRANPAKRRRDRAPPTILAPAPVPTHRTQDSRRPLAGIPVNVSQGRYRRSVGPKTEDPQDSGATLKSSPAAVLSATLDDGALPDAPPTTEENSEDEDELWAELLDPGSLLGADDDRYDCDDDTYDCDDDRYDSDDDDRYDSDDEESSPSCQDNSHLVAHFVVDQAGHIRVGPQPFPERPFVRTAPVVVATSFLRMAVQINLNLTDSKFVNLDKQDMGCLVEDLARHLLSRMVTYKEGHIYLIDDYTGLDLSWATGRPDAPSMEAMYPFIVGKGQVLYHAPANVSIVSASLNWLKRRHPIIVLPLLGLWLRTIQNPNFEQRKAAMAWVYTAVLNAGVMGRVLHYTQPHKKQIEEWQRWSPEKMEAVLEHNRTGTYGPVIGAALDGKSLDELFLDGSGASWRKAVRQAPDWNIVYRWLVKIASKYGLTQDDFDYYFTLPAPASSGSKCRVFYPYYVLSRAQAKEMSWDWPCLLNVAAEMLDQMRRYCNKHGQAEGYGEHEMNPLRLIYWWGHHLCRNVQVLKDQQPPLTREEIAYSIVDQWGFPVVPWTFNILKASLCRARDHGVAMRFGLNLPNDGQPFDPVAHWDFFLCTVTVDSQATNMAMRNFAAGFWGSIRQTIMAVQPSHTHWRLDRDLGLRSWAGEFETEPQPRQPPVLPYEIPLVPIDAWLGDSTTPPALQCTECPDAGNFATPGLLVRHYQEQHGQQPSAARGVDPGQDKVDEAFWNDCLTCHRCAKTFSKARCLAVHVKEQHSGKTYHCPEPDCTASYTYRYTLAQHMALKHSGEPPVRFPCTEPGCKSSYSRPGDRDRHIAQKHSGKPPNKFFCSVPGCQRSYASRDSLQFHVRNKHPADSAEPVKFTCTHPGCGKPYTSRHRLNEHVRLKHSAEPPVRFPCTEPGCDQTFGTARYRAHHVKTVHGEKQSAAPPKKVRATFTCTHPGCGKPYSSRDRLDEHVRLKHSVEPPVRFPCTEPGCDQTFSVARSVRQHVRKIHGKGSAEV